MLYFNSKAFPGDLSLMAANTSDDVYDSGDVEIGIAALDMVRAFCSYWRDQNQGLP